MLKCRLPDRGRVLGNRSVGQQLAISLMLSMALALAIASVGLHAQSQLGASLQHVHRTSLPAVDFLDQADRDLQQLLVSERSLLTTAPGDARRAKYIKDFDENLRQSRERLAKYRALASDQKQVEVYGKYARARQRWESTAQQVMALIRAGDVNSREKAIALSTGQGSIEFEAMRAPINELEDLVNEGAAKAAAEAVAAESAARRSMFGPTASASARSWRRRSRSGGTPARRFRCWR